MSNRDRFIRYMIGLIIVLLVVVLIARTLETYGGSAFIKIGLLSDKICYAGSYEFVVCTHTALPNETLMVVLGVLLVVFAWASGRGQTHDVRKNRRASRLSRALGVAQAVKS